MAKRKRKKFPAGQPSSPAKVPSKPFFSKRQWQAIGIGVILIISGFVVLSFTDPAGQNWQSTVSPALLILGYTVVGFALAARDKQDLASPSPERDR